MFITFEGVEGCGKTTQVRLLAERFAGRGVPVLMTREPGGAAISEQIRALILDAKNDDMEPLTEALLYEAARAQFVRQIVRPALAAGTTVICDRFTDSTLAYQGYGRGLDLPALETLNGIATSGLTPNLTILLDVSVAAGLERRRQGGDWNRLDAAGRDFHERVAAGYATLAASNAGGRWRVVDGTGEIETVAAAVWSVVGGQRSAVGGRQRNTG